MTRLLPILLLAIAILLLAGPRRFEQPRSEREMTNILFCLDVSGSMTAPFGAGSRYDAAMTSLNDFISFRKGDAFGLTVFGILAILIFIGAALIALGRWDALHWAALAAMLVAMAGSALATRLARMHALAA